MLIMRCFVETKLLREMGTIKNTYDINQSQKPRHSNFQSISIKPTRYSAECVDVIRINDV